MIKFELHENTENVCFTLQSGEEELSLYLADSDTDGAINVLLTLLCLLVDSPTSVLLPNAKHSVLSGVGAESLRTVKLIKLYLPKDRLGEFKIEQDIKPVSVTSYITEDGLKITENCY